MNDAPEQRRDLEAVQPPPPAEHFGQAMLQILSNPNIPADKLEIVLKYNAQNILEQQKEAFNLAYARMAPHIPQVSKEGYVELVGKDGVNRGSYKFARWEDMDRVLRPILAEHGFALAHRSDEHPDRVKVVSELVYGGYSKTSTIVLPPDIGPGRNSLQAFGGAISYGKRYNAEQLLNIVRRDEDNDGVGPFGDRTINAEQLQHLEQLLSQTRTDKQRILGWCGVTELGMIEVRDYERFVRALSAQKEKGK